MRELLIKVEEQDWERLQYLAECRQVMPEELAREVLSQWLQMTEEDWQKRMEQLLQAFRRVSQHLSPEEIEAEITAAYEEYRQQCAP
jgi:arsenate reductase-like glutaredoxin family protein